jgi:polyisoprenoid-binding protein YceI
MSKTDILDSGFAQRVRISKVNAKQFPLITLKRKSVQKVSNRQYTVFGDLTFLGVTKPVTVQANVTGQGQGTAR